MKKKFFFILLIIVFFLICSLLIKKNIEPFIINNSYDEACEELVNKRLFLKAYLGRLKEPVQAIKNKMIESKIEKQNNIAYQRVFTEKCSNLTPSIDSLNNSNEFINNSTEAKACRALASVDKYQLEILPDIDIFYATVLLENKEKLNEAFKLINFYTNMMKCPINNDQRVTLDDSENIIDASGNTVNQNSRINVQRDIGVLNTRELILELEKLSPYYLSPDVVRYIIRFMISQEKLDYLNDSSVDFVLGTENLMDKIKSYY
jgi:hypothetical protein